MNLNLHLLAFCLFLGLAAGENVEVEPNAGDPELLKTYPNFLVLSSNTYELYWKYTAGTSRLDIAVRVRTTGWVGFGVSERGNMVNADIAVGWVTDQGEVQLQDRYSGSNGSPSEDTRNNLNIIRGKEDHGWTILEFWRFLDTGDTGVTENVNHDRIITEGDTAVIFAYGESDGFSYHMTRRGAVGVYFLGGEREETTGSKTVQFLVRNITIPSFDTTYWCTGFRLPQEIRSSVRHVIKFAPVIHEPATPHVHHMLLHTCDGIEFGDVTEEMLTGGHCFALGPGGMASPWSSCMTGNLIGAWAVGGGPFVFPEDISYSFGGPKSSEYLMIQMHYDNPNMIVGERDSSGFELTYVDSPRRYDAGTLAIGHSVTPNELIPPGQDNFDVYGFCEPSCSSKHLPADGINVISNLLHTHLAGHGLVLRQYRNGVEVTPPIDQDLNYDFNFQQVRTIPSRKIYPGDRLELLCKYYSSDRNSTVFGGIATYQEMCLSFLYYYPRTPLIACESSPRVEYLVNALRPDLIPSLNITSQSLVQQLLFQYLPHNDFPWDKNSRVENIQGIYNLTRTNSSLLNTLCITNEDTINIFPTSGSTPLLLSFLVTATTVVTGLIFNAVSA